MKIPDPFWWKVHILKLLYFVAYIPNSTEYEISVTS